MVRRRQRRRAERPAGRDGITGEYKNFLSDPDSALILTITAAVWRQASFAGILLLAGLQSLPSELNEAAFRVIDVLNTPRALIISYNVFTLPLAILILKNYFDQFPRAIEEAAKIDGASRLQTLVIIVLPIARPGLVAAGVLIFLEAWSEFFYALVLTNQLTVPPLLAGFQSVQQFNWNALAAATVMSMIPPVLLVIMFQRNVVGSLTAGVVK